jgi:hypothetical protein
MCLVSIFMKVFTVWEARNGGRKASRNLELRIARHADECLESERLPLSRQYLHKHPPYRSLFVWISFSDCQFEIVKFQDRCIRGAR